MGVNGLVRETTAEKEGVPQDKEDPWEDLKFRPISSYYHHFWNTTFTELISWLLFSWISGIADCQNQVSTRVKYQRLIDYLFLLLVTS